MLIISFLLNFFNLIDRHLLQHLELIGVPAMQ